MDYIKKVFNDENDMYVSFPSTDDNIICKGGKTLRKQFEDIPDNFTTEQTNNKFIIKYGDKVIARIPIGGVITPVKYTVTNNLTNATNSNDVTEIEESQSYTATITADSGYEINSVTVTMGGTDITNTAYNNGNINISSVTGNIVITAICSEIVQPTSYSITNNLTNYTTNNNKTSIDSSAKYVAKLEPKLEYKPNTLSISMGGRDITNDVYDKYERTITINSVTGDIIINANGVPIEDVVTTDSTLTLMRGHATQVDSSIGNMSSISCNSNEYIEIDSEEIIVSSGYNGLLLFVICYDENKRCLGAISGDRYNVINLPWDGKKRSICVKEGTKFIKLGFSKADKYMWVYDIQPLYKDAINGFIIINNKKYVFTPYCDDSITGIGNYKVDGNYTVDGNRIEINSYTTPVNSSVLLHPITIPFNDKSFYDIEFICDENNAIIDSIGKVTRLSDKEFTVTIKATNAGNTYTTNVVFESINVESVNSIDTLNMSVGETYSIPYSTSPVINYSDSVSLEKTNTDDIIRVNDDNSITALNDGTSSVNIVAKNFTKTIPVVVGKEISEEDGEFL